jgi:hypothetical protein
VIDQICLGSSHLDTWIFFKEFIEVDQSSINREMLARQVENTPRTPHRDSKKHLSAPIRKSRAQQLKKYASKI